MSLNNAFPNILNEHFVITSDLTTSYNCIAWAFGDNTKWYWPAECFSYWPPNIKNVVDDESFIQLYGLIGYAVCENNSLEWGKEKIAIYTLNGVPTHAARQLENGYWTSKLGEWHDVEHSAIALNNSPDYGDATIFMSRNTKNLICRFLKKFIPSFVK